MDLNGSIDQLIDKLRAAGWKDRSSVRDELIALLRGADGADTALDYLEQKKKEVNLELRWEVDAVIEALQPEPEPEEEPEEEADDPNRPLTASDLNLVYDDPRGLALHKSKTGDRWFATQRDPRTGQPQTFELHATEVGQLKTQLKGSPYWVLGSGEAS